VLALLLIDLVILITYTTVAGVQGSLTVVRIPNRENPMAVHEVGLCTAPSNPVQVVGMYSEKSHSSASVHVRVCMV